jgi:hypothetical protein
MSKLATFQTWAEAREALRLLQIVYGEEDHFVGAIFGAPGLYEGTFEEGGRALWMRDIEWAADAIAYT